VSAAIHPSVATVSYQVVPMWASERLGDREVVADRHVEEAGLVGLLHDRPELVGAGVGSPTLDERLRLRLDLQLHAVDELSRRGRSCS
jgi:hypothetical protein